MNTSEVIAAPKKKFDPYEKDCFASFLNMTDDEVSTLILRIGNHLSQEGEYDQGDRVVLDWDDVRDLTVIAERLWTSRLRTTFDTAKPKRNLEPHSSIDCKDRDCIQHPGLNWCEPCYGWICGEPCAR